MDEKSQKISTRCPDAARKESCAVRSLSRLQPWRRAGVIRFTQCHYSLEWNAHAPAALKAGVDQKTIDIVRRNGALTGVDEKDAAVIRFGRQMLHDGRMDSATFAKAAQLFGKKGAMDLVAVMSTYAVSGFYAIAVDEHMPPGRPDLESAPRQ
jgi:hypothetical protein